MGHDNKFRPLGSGEKAQTYTPCSCWMDVATSMMYAGNSKSTMKDSYGGDLIT